MFNFKKHTNTLTIRDLTNKIHVHLGHDAVVAFMYVCKYPATKVTDIYIRWVITDNEGYTIRFDADYVDEILKDNDLADKFASSLAIKFKKMHEIDHKIEEGSQTKESK